MVLDRMSTLCSYQLQSKLDYNKRYRIILPRAPDTVLLFMVLACSATRLHLESPLPTAMLLSLTGVGSVFMKQWYSSIEDTSTTMKSTFEGTTHTCTHQWIRSSLSLTPGLLSAPSAVGEVYWSLVKKAVTPEPAAPDKPSNDNQPSESASTSQTAPDHGSEARAMYNFVLYGLPHLTVIANS